MRTMKNSSRLLAKIARNLARSSNGIRSSSASCSTRSLKSSHDSSRFAYSSVESSAGGSVVSSTVVLRSSVASAKWTLLLHVHCNGERVLFPLAQEARVQHLAASTQVRDERLESAVAQAIGRLAGRLRVEVGGIGARALAQRCGVLEAEPGDVPLDARDRLVAVVDLAQQVLQALRALRRLRGRLAEHR